MITYRSGHKDDLHFILSTWLRGVYYDSLSVPDCKECSSSQKALKNLYNSIPKQIFFESYDLIIKSILNRPKTNVLVACQVEDPDMMLGYCVVEEDALHWLYVKDIWRNIGIAKDLLKHFNLKTTTHLTRIGKMIKPKEMTYNPFLV